MKPKHFLKSFFPILLVSGLFVSSKTQASDEHESHPVAGDAQQDAVHQGSGSLDRVWTTKEKLWHKKLEEAQRIERISSDDYKAEEAYYALMGPPYPENLRKRGYPILIEFYTKNNMRVKLIEMYERFIAKFPGDSELPEVYFRLGNLYREFGAFNKAMESYYSVLSTTVRSPRNAEEQREFDQTSRRAQIEIADLFLQMGDLENAVKFFDRLLVLQDLDLPGSSRNRARVEFKRASCKYLSANEESDPGNQKRAFAEAEAYLTHCGKDNIAFYEAYPDHKHAPESHYLLAVIYKRLGGEANRDKAHKQIRMLLDKANKGVRAQQVTLRNTKDLPQRYEWDDDRGTWIEANGRPATKVALAEISNQVLSQPKGKTGVVYLQSTKFKPKVYTWTPKSNEGEEAFWKNESGERADEEAMLEIGRQIDQWVGWQKKAGNQVANEYFEDGETLKAIEVYQKMILLDPSAKWQAPVVYQLGLCFERLGGGMYNAKAIEAYEILTNADKNPKTWQVDVEGAGQKKWSNVQREAVEKKSGSEISKLDSILSPQEEFIYRMAEWRLKNLRWNLTAQNEIKRLEN